MWHFGAEKTANSFDSDPRLHAMMRVHQGFRRFGQPMANGLANNFGIRPKLFRYSGRLRRNEITAGFGFQITSMTREHEAALSFVPPSQKRLLRFRQHHQNVREPQN